VSNAGVRGAAEGPKRIAPPSDDFYARLPKAELHLHIEGTFEPELIFTIAERNALPPPYPTIETARAAYHFDNLQSFLDLYYKAMNVLRTEQDFADLADAYFRRAKAQGVVHAEIFFDPQAHLDRGLAFETFFDGLWSIVSQSEKRYGMTSGLIMCFLRDQSEQSAQNALTAALPHCEKILGVGLDSAESGNPPSKFAAVYDRARVAGWHCVAHAGEEGPPEYVWEALDVLQAERIDHGVRSLEDPLLVRRLREERIPLTVCPFSNVKLRVVDTLRDHPLRTMLDAGLVATCNSDDPAYFDGYVADNLRGVCDALGMGKDYAVTLARNSFEASFLSPAIRSAYLAQLDDAVNAMASG
jgi:adenosine deaminase